MRPRRPTIRQRRPLPPPRPTSTWCWPARVRPEQIQAAEALVDQAQNGVSPWQVRLNQAKITAPRGGTITELVLHEGEVAAAGSPIVRLADLSEVTLTVYVPEPDLGQAHLGQTVEVAVDSFPGRLYPGTVTQVSDQAEFTPKNVQEHATSVPTPSMP